MVAFTVSTMGVEQAAAALGEVDGVITTVEWHAAAALGEWDDASFGIIRLGGAG